MVGRHHEGKNWPMASLKAAEDATSAQSVTLDHFTGGTGS